MSTHGTTGGWVRACGLAEIGEDRALRVDVGECPVCLVRTGGVVYALREECTRGSVPLSEGEVADGATECWLHGSCFDLATGRALSRPATRPVAVFVPGPTVRTSSSASMRAGRADGITRWADAPAAGHQAAGASVRLPGGLRQVAAGGERVEQQVEVHQPAVGPPAA
jgi:3-phenylpropionate/trans-cinnamate dioxygenase ferredoxin component